MYVTKPKPRQGFSEVTFAKDQPEYLPLPANVMYPYVETEWKLTLAERIKVLLGGSVHLTVMTFGQPLQPLRMSATRLSDEDFLA